MKTSRFAMTALFCGLSIVAVSSVFAAPPKLEKILRPLSLFRGPVQLPLDWCNPLSKNCGKATADAYCKQKYGQNTRAIAFAIAPKLGKTQTLGGEICTSPRPFNHCDGFTYITCAVMP